jgi:sulfur carrier protein
MAETFSITLNGEKVSTQAQTLQELLTAFGYGDAMVATALNGTFVPLKARAQTRLAAGDVVDVVAPMQGG